MAGIRQTRTGSWELTLRNKLLPKTLYFTFATREDAAAYAAEAEKWLAAGVVPAALLRPLEPKKDAIQLSMIIREWRTAGRLSKTDNDILGWLSGDANMNVPLNDMNYTWAETWVQSMKLGKNYAPSSIRQRVQAVSKALDWHLRHNPNAMFTNPLRLLPKGYSVYTEKDGPARKDVVRDRRLHEGEAERIRGVLSGDMAVLFEFILYTGARLREAYTVRKENVNLAARVVRLQTTKQRHGHVAYRDVPIRPELYPALSGYLTTGEGLLFPFWDGSPATLQNASSRLSQMFSTAFKHAGCENLTEHDLRHEATCQWFELKDAKGVWLFRAEEISRIMGWSPGSAMASRYASFRAVSLAERLWAGQSS